MNSTRIAIAVLAALLMQQAPARAQRADNGVVTGQLRGTSGAPATGVRVAAMAVPEANATGGNALVSLVETDSAGRYRLENVPPGRYFIQAGFIDGPSYYPGVSSTATATSVLVTAGATVTGIDFTMTRGAGVRVSGRLPLTLNPRPAQIRLMGGGPGNPFGPGGPGSPNVAAIGADGSFEFLRVAPGNYTLSVSSFNAALPNLPIVVTDKDINVGLPAGPGVKVSGLVGLGANSPRPANLRVVLTGSSAWAQLEVPINAAGEFEFPNVPAGTYSLRTVPGSSAEIAKVIAADREIRGLVIPALVELAGQVTLADGSTLPTASTALMIAAERADGTSTATAAGRNGAFRLPLGEGEYRISFGKLPPGLAVKSMSYGPSDLLANPLKLNGASALTEIRLILEKK